MDPFVKRTLTNLSYIEAKAWWEYLDSDPDAVTDMIEVIASNHKVLSDDLCGVDETEKEIRQPGPVGYEPVVGETDPYFQYGYTGYTMYEEQKVSFPPYFEPCNCIYCNQPDTAPPEVPLTLWQRFLNWFCKGTDDGLGPKLS